jgi:hypothetical protein
VLYGYYFGTRQLTAKKAAMQPSDLAGVKIRAIPFPIYMMTVEGLGAVPVPVDWSEDADGARHRRGQRPENPVNVVLSSKLYEAQSHLMLTGHHERSSSSSTRRPGRGCRRNRRRRSARRPTRCARGPPPRSANPRPTSCAKLKELKMTVVGPTDGLKLTHSRVRWASSNAKFSAKYGDLYKEIGAVK